MGIGRFPLLNTLLLGHSDLDEPFINSMFDLCPSLEVIQLTGAGTEFWKTINGGRKISCYFNWETWVPEDTVMARARLDDQLHM